MGGAALQVTVVVRAKRMVDISVVVEGGRSNVRR